MKYTKKRRFFIFILIIVTLFSCTACDALEDNQDFINDQDWEDNQNNAEDDGNQDGHQDQNNNNVESNTSEEIVSPPQDEPTQPSPG